MVEEIRELIRRHALLNAVSYNGKANSKAVIGKILAEKEELRSRVKEILPLVEEIVNEVNKMSLEEQLKMVNYSVPLKSKEEKKILPPLPRAEKGKVVTRFPPEPSGYLHIGHAKAAIIDHEYARMYQGKFILRFDDTNPVNAKIEYYEAIKEDLNWLGIKPDIIENTSDDLEKLYYYAERLIEKGFAYVCLCDPETIKVNRMKGIECDCRNSSSELNLERWEKMFKEYSRNEAVLRFKGNMKSLNTVMRDPTLFRIIEEEHPLKGNKYRVWPTYDFAAPVKDSLDGVTHALRTKEYELRDELYFSILKALELREPILIEFSRLEMKGSVLSKRKIREMISKGLVSGWDDPRLATLRALRRRGYQPEAIKEFILSLGVSKVESEPTWDLINSINRKIIDPRAKRLFFVSEPVKVKLEGFPLKKVRLKYHPDRDLGEREIEVTENLFINREDFESIKEGEKIRLMDLGNFVIIGGKFLFDGFELDHKLKKFHWVNEKALDLKVLFPLEDKLIKGKVEDNFQNLNIGDIVQFVRFGFCKIDSKDEVIFIHK